MVPVMHVPSRGGSSRSRGLSPRACGATGPSADPSSLPSAGRGCPRHAPTGPRGDLSWKSGSRHRGPQASAWVALLLVTALDASLLQQLAGLLLRHPLASLLDDRAHSTTYLVVDVEQGAARSAWPQWSPTLPDRSARLDVRGGQ